MTATGCRVLKAIASADSERNMMYTAGTVRGVNEGEIEIIWDDGESSTLSNSKEKDLLVLDNAASGVMHKNITCSNCSAEPLPGIRWRCKDCKKCSLCSTCYHDGAHFQNHAFERISTPESGSSLVGRRAGQSKRNVRGVFEGAKVVCGPDWPHGGKYGGKEFKGEVERLVDHKGIKRNVVKVKDPSEPIFRLGHTGKVDVVCSRDSKVFKKVYVEHLPKFGSGEKVDVVCSRDSKVFNKVYEKHLPKFGSGEKGKLPASSLETVPLLSDVCKTFEGDCSQENFNRCVLEGEVQKLQEFCISLLDKGPIPCEWLGKAFHLALEKSHLDAFKILCAFAQPHEYKNENGDPPIHVALRKLSDETLKTLLQGDVFDTPLLFDPTLFDSRGYNLLHLAVYKGNTEFVNYLLAKFPEIVNNQMEKNGFTPLHLAAFWNREDIAERLMKEPKCIVNMENVYKQTSLHLAAAQGYSTLVEKLLDYGADVNSQDEDGNPAFNYYFLRQNDADKEMSPEIAGRNDPKDAFDSCEKCEAKPAMALLFLPCGHKSTCIGCSKEAKYCNMCKKAVHKRIIPENDSFRIGED